MYFLEAKRGKNKIEAVSWIKKMTEFLGKVRKDNNNKNIANVVRFCVFFSEWDNFLEDFSGITKKYKILTVIKLLKILTEMQFHDR